MPANSQQAALRANPWSLHDEKLFRVCCEHCGMPKRRREPVQECWVVGEQHFLHGGCRAGWEAAPAMQLPSGIKVFGIAPGHRCEHCSSGRDVYLIQLPGEEEAADRHKECAARYWRKMQEVHPDSCARHSSRHDYNCHIGSAEWKRFRSEVIKQRGNRCERCGQVSASLELHHLHYHSLGSEQPEDAELLCPECHKRADEARAAKGRPKHFEPAVLQDGRYVPMPTLKWKGKS